MSELAIHPAMTVYEAARVAHENGYELYLRWEGGTCRVVAFRPIAEVPEFLKLQAG